MMEMLQGWLLGLTAAALAVSLLTAMLPKGETMVRLRQSCRRLISRRSICA